MQRCAILLQLSKGSFAQVVTCEKKPRRLCPLEPANIAEWLLQGGHGHHPLERKGQRHGAHGGKHSRKRITPAVRLDVWHDAGVLAVLCMKAAEERLQALRAHLFLVPR